MERCTMIHKIPRSIAFGICLLLCSTGFAQDRAELEKRYEEKRKKKFVQHIEWVTNLEEAKKISQEKNLPILAYFTRSYAP